MPHSCFLVRTALLDPTRKVVAHEVAWQRAGKASDDALLPLLASALHDEDKGWLLADGHLVVPLAPSTLPALLDSALPPGGMTIAIDAGAFDGATFIPFRIKSVNWDGSLIFTTFWLVESLPM